MHNAQSHFSNTARNRSSTMIGRGKVYHLNDGEMREVNSLLSCDSSFTQLETPLVRSYDKASAQGITFYSRGYTRVKKQNSYTVAFEDPQFLLLWYC